MKVNKMEEGIIFTVYDVKDQIMMYPVTNPYIAKKLKEEFDKDLFDSKGDLCLEEWKDISIFWKLLFTLV